MADQPIHRPTTGCYVYDILVEGVVRYVGKGTGRRVYVHFATARRLNAYRAKGKTVRTSDFYNSLAKAIREGREVGHRIVIDGLTDDEAFAAEAARIAELGFASLWNETPGGDGFRLDQVKDPDGFHDKLIEGVRRSWTDPQRRKTASEAARKRWEDPKQREQHRQILRKRWADPELREKHAQIFRDRFATTDEMSEHQRRAVNTRFEDPKQREAVSVQARQMQASRRAARSK